MVDSIEVLEDVWVKPSRTTDTGITITLSPLDYVVPDVNASLLLFLRLSPDSEDQISFSRLKRSLSQALSRYPELAGELRPAKDGGPEEIHLLDRGARFVHARSLEPLKKLEERGWAASALSPKLVVGGPLPSPTDPLLAVQLTEFPDNAIALAFRRRHKVTDLPGFTQFLRSWSELTQGDGATQLPALRSFNEMNHSLSSLGAHDTNVTTITPPTLPPDSAVRIALHPRDMGMTRPPGPMVTQLFHISAVALSELKSRAHKDLSEGQWVSTADAIGALFWRAGTRARRMAADTNVKLGVAVNAREIMKANPAASAYFGNAIVGVCPAMPVKELLETPLSRSAHAIREKLLVHKSSSVGALLSSLSNLPPATIPLLRPAHTDVFGPDMSLTSWASYPFYDTSKYGFGTQEVIKVSAGTGAGDGVVIVLPTKPSEHGESDGLEVLVGLTADSAPRLLEDPELLEFARPICG